MLKDLFKKKLYIDFVVKYFVLKFGKIVYDKLVVV